MSMLSYWKSLILPNFSFGFIAAITAALPTIASVVGITAGVNSLMGGDQPSSTPGSPTATANPLAPYQQQWAQRLSDIMGQPQAGGTQLAQYNQLLSDPSSVTQTPGYQFGMEQGAQQLQRVLAATGQTQSGQEQIALQKYGQGYAGQQYQQQLQNLMQGTNLNMNFGQSNISNLSALSQGGAVSGAQYGAGQQQQGYQNVMQGLGGLSSIYGGTSGYTGGYNDLGTATPIGNTGAGFYPSGGSGYDVGSFS